MQDLLPNTDMRALLTALGAAKCAAAQERSTRYGVLNAIVQDGSLFGFAWGY